MKSGEALVLPDSRTRWDRTDVRAHILPSAGTTGSVPAWFHSPTGVWFPEPRRRTGSETEHEAPGSIIVAGESFGGPIAIHYVLAFPDRVQRLVLINTFLPLSLRLRIRLACLTCPLLRLPASGASRTSSRHDSSARGIDAAGLAHYRDVIRQVDLDAYGEDWNW